ncbi:MULTISPECIES: phosphopantetheine-binding protein [Actinosynnema]|uniref:Carrier domain-containing protein n=1 Tax=Actinosynnema pretiosum TaxID=42197 RepID=A0A290ZA32_9PSEU|nr:phosphopantetheine-binding protein [Actinosynnema pretiosum]ATE55829.1 hypothetical protein CNX65_23210 [Actinosynnema pretiosum]
MTIQKITEDAAAERVALVWERALKVSPVAHDADFLSLGGNSLLLLSIITEVEDVFDVELDVDEVVEDLTVAGMARVVARTAG